MARKLLSKKIVKGAALIALFSATVIACKKDSTDPTDPSDDPPQNKVADTIDCNDPIKNGGVFANDPQAAVDYVVTCELHLNGDVTIEPGTVIEFTTDAGLQVNGNGSLSVNGTKDEPVILTGTDKAAGSWKGLLFDSDDTKNSMSYTTVDYAGGKAFNSNGDLGGVIVWAGTKLKMENCTIKNSAAYGLNANYTDADVTLNNNTFTKNSMPANIKAELLSMATGSNDFSGNTKDFVRLSFYTAEINGAATWHKINVPYLAEGTQLTANAKLTIEPGTEVVMGQGTYIHIKEKGAIVAVGTANDPIIFRGEVAQPGGWEGIGISFTSNPLNEIGFAKIMHAGGDNRDGAIYMWAEPVLSVHDVDFSDVKTCALYAAPSSSSPNTNLNLGNNSYTNCGGQLCGD